MTCGIGSKLHGRRGNEMQVTVIGAGYVGLVTSASLAAIGHQVVCVDVLSDRVEMINRGEVPFYEPGLAELIQDGIQSGRLHATTNLAKAICNSQISMIAVGTPPQSEHIDLSYVATAAQQIGQVLRYTDGYHVVVVKSTVVPGTTDTLVLRLLEGNRSGG